MSAGDRNGNGTGTEREPLDLLAEEFVRRHRQGEAPSVSEYARRHPELAEQIRETFPAVLMLERLKPLSTDLSSAATSARRELAALKVERLGDYRILREVGRGGMGVVYEAEQESLGRRVALKVLPNHVGLSETTRRRFALEAKAAARLHHTNIVPVFGVGEENGVHYYVMQFIHGQGLDAVLAELRRMRRNQDPSADELPPAEPTASLSTSRGRQYWDSVARVGVQVAEALQYAHDAGTLHRDVKPSNLMLDTRGSVWVTDFGLAKLDDQPDLTRDTDVLGTLRYMAPERFVGKCDARSDVYGIGLVLYELLTLRPAYGASDRHRLVQQITQGTGPARPRSIDPDVPRDLETVVLKASARDPADRYASAGRLAQDLRRFLEDKPVAARRTGNVERLRRWCRRNPLVAGLTASVAALLLAATVASLVVAARFHGLADRERHARGDAEESRVAAERTLAEIYPLNGFAAASRGNDAEAVVWFSAAARLSGRGTPGEALNHVRAAVWSRGAVSPVAAFKVGAHPVTRLAFDRPSKVLLVEAAGSNPVAWDLTRGEETSYNEEVTPHIAPATAPGISATWTSADADRRIVASGVGDQVTVSDAAESREVVTITPRRGPTACGAVSPDGAAVLVVPAAADHAPALWSVPGGERLPVELEALAGAQAVAFSPGGRFVASAHALRPGGALVRVWALPANALPHVRVPLVPRYAVPRFDRAATLVIASGVGTAHDVLRAVQPFSLETGRAAGPEITPGGIVHAADFSPDGARVVSASRRTDGSNVLEFWDRTTGARVGLPVAPRGQPMALEFNPSGETLAVLCAGGDVALIKPAGADGAAPMFLRSWKAEYAPESNQSLIRSAGLRFAPDGRTLVTWGTRAAEVWDVDTGALRYPPLRHDGRCGDVQFSPDGRHIATAGWDGTARVWEAATGAPAAAPLSHGRDNVVLSARFVPPDGKLLLTSCFDGAVRLWDWQPNRLAHPPAKDEFYTSGVVTPDGRWVVTAAGGDAVRVLDCVTGAPVTPPMRVTSVPWQVEVAYAPAGNARYAAVGGTGDTIDVFRLDDLYPSDKEEETDRQSLATIISGQRLEGGAVVRLTPDEWWDCWQRAPDPATFDPASPDTLEWHRLRGNDARGRNDAAAAAFHLARLVAAGAADWSECQACARQQVALGRWADAVRSLAEAVRLRPADTDLRTAYADALHGVGRADDAAGELEKAAANKLFARGNWWVVGPFRFGGSIEEILPPETQDDLTLPVPSDEGKSLRWSPLSTTGPWAAFDTTFGTTPNVVGYARQLVHFRGNAPQRVTLSVGSDDLCALWLNGQRVYQYDAAPRIAKPDDARVTATLRPGWNTLLGKVVNVTGGAKLYVEILPEGAAE